MIQLLLAFFKRYTLDAICIVIVSIALIWLMTAQYKKGYKAGSADEAAKSLVAAYNAQERSDALAAELNEKLRKALTASKNEGKLREVIRENPSNCSVPEPVFKQLLKNIDLANEASI